MTRIQRPDRARRVAAGLTAILLAVAFAILAHNAADRTVFDVDRTAQATLRAWRSPALDGPMRAFSTLGSGTVLVPCNIALAMVLWRRRYRYPVLISALTLGAVALEGLSKWLVNRPRPKAVGYGFPSGHVIATIVCFGLVLYVLWRARRGDALARIATGAGIVAVLGIGLSRMYLNSHWLSDVLGGIAAGLAFLIVSLLQLGTWLCARTEETDAPAPARAPVHARRWRVAPEWLLVAGVAMLSLVDVGTRIIASNDEARFPVMAQHLLSGGDWLVPSLNGSAYVNKPPLLAWCIAAASWRVGRVTDLTAVVPSVLAGLLTVFVVYRLGRELWNPATGRYAAAIAATSQGLFLHARLAMPDMMLTAFVTLSFWALARMRRRADGLAWVGFYAAVAAACWAKGPPGLMPLGAAIVYAAARRHAQPMGWLSLGRGALLLTVLLAPWGMAAASQAAGTVHDTLIVDYVLWYVPRQPSILMLVTPLQHVASVVFPWVWVAPFMLVDAWRVRRGRGAERDAVVLVLVWAVVVFAMVCVSQQQRLRYYLPLVPPLSLLLGWWLAAAAVQRRAVTVWPLRFSAALAATAAAVAVVWSASHGHDWREAWDVVAASAWQSASIVVAGLAFVAAMELGLRQRHAGRAVPVAVVAAAVLVIGVNHVEQARRNADQNYAALTRLTAAVRGPHEPVAALGIPALPIAFYLGERVAELSPAGHGAEAGLLVVADARLLAREGADVAVAATATLARQPVVIGHLAASPAGVAMRSVPPASADRAGDGDSAASRHIALEVLCVMVALAALVGRTVAVRHGAGTGVVFAMEATSIVALASFPAHALIFVGGVLAAAACGYVRWRRPASPAAPQLLAGALLVLALPLDVLDDILRGESVKADPIWTIAALIGVALITWHRLYRASA